MKKSEITQQVLAFGARKLNLKAVVTETATGYEVSVPAPFMSCFLSCKSEVRKAFSGYPVTIVSNTKILIG